ncbi:MAG: CinA family protein [Gemmatimonadaceae bacterium]|nr:CinA family protein [Chitinophagaceae bacterium]
MFDQKAIRIIRDTLLSQGKTLAVAESVTAGLLQAALSTAETASFFFQGGMTTYNLGQKTKLLDVEPIEAERNNCVSVAVAEQMARGICERFHSDYGIGITGYAATIPEKNVDELFAFFAIAKGAEILKSGKFSSEKKEPIDVQIDYTDRVLKEFSEILG